MHSQDTVRIPLRARDGSIRAYAIVDAADAEWVSQWRWHLEHGYVVRTECSEGRRYPISLHRELLGLPRAKDGREGDHIDRDRLNHCRSNLRILSLGHNRQNKGAYRGSSSVHRGVSWDKQRQKWRVDIQAAKVREMLGYFDDEMEAAEVARSARMRLMPYAVD